MQGAKMKTPLLALSRSLIRRESGVLTKYKSKERTIPRPSCVSSGISTPRLGKLLAAKSVCDGLGHSF